MFGICSYLIGYLLIFTVIHGKYAHLIGYLNMWNFLYPPFRTHPAFTLFCLHRYNIIIYFQFPFRLVPHPIRIFNDPWTLVPAQKSHVTDIAWQNNKHHILFFILPGVHITSKNGKIFFRKIFFQKAGILKTGGHLYSVW